LKDFSLEDVRNCKNEEEMVQLYKEGRPGAHLELAKSSHATDYIFELLVRLSSVPVLHEVAKNSNTPRSILEELIGHKDMLVCDYARRNLDYQKTIEEDETIN
jgi:tRNA nucleotidyltransferase/poly(A) polymerase